jgi:hypothetical protein
MSSQQPTMFRPKLKLNRDINSKDFEKLMYRAAKAERIELSKKERFVTRPDPMPRRHE